MRFAMSSLSADKIKTCLTMLGVAIGTASIILVVNITSTGSSYIVSQIEGIGANLAYASLDRSGPPTVPDDELVPADLDLVRRSLPGYAVAGTYDIPFDLRISNQSIHARMVGVTEDFQKIRDLDIISGRYLDAEDFSGHFKPCLLSSRLAAAIFGAGKSLGNVITLAHFKFTIIGIFKERVPTFGQSEIQENTVLIPFVLVKELTGDDFFQVLYAQATSHERVRYLTSRLNELLHVRHREQAHYIVENLSSLIETASKVTVAMGSVLLAIAGLTITIAGVGIMNIMQFNVSQRTHEIGLRKALGAKPSQIRLQFLLEACVVSCVGAVSGAGVALWVTWAVASVVGPSLSSNVSWLSVWIALAISMGVGILFGYGPATGAATLDPIDALRVE